MFLKEGEVVPVEIQIWPTGMVFHAGEQLELIITGRDFTELRPPNMIVVQDYNQGIHSVHTGGRFDTYLLLPLEDHTHK